MKFGLTLSGGGIRGAAHIGVLKALHDDNLIPSAISGTSIGAIVAGLYAYGFTPKELEKIGYNFSKKGISYLDVNICDILRFIPESIIKWDVSLNGLFRGEKLRKYFKELTNEATIKNVPMKIVIPAVDLYSSNTVVFTNSKFSKIIENVIWDKNILLCDAMIASASVPGIFSPRKINKYFLVDGGVTNVMPTDLLVSTGISKVIAVDVGKKYEKDDKYNIFEVINDSMKIMGDRLKDCKSTKDIMTLKPPLPKKAGLLSFDYIVDCMEAGYIYTKKMIPFIKKSLY